jgi:hypothetical protein
MPTLERLAQTRRETLQVLGVNLDTVNPANARAFVRELGLTFPILLNPDLGVGRTYRVLGLPTSYVVDRGAWCRTARSATATGPTVNRSSSSMKPCGLAERKEHRGGHVVMRTFDG